MNIHTKLRLFTGWSLLLITLISVTLLVSTRMINQVTLENQVANDMIRDVFELGALAADYVAHGSERARFQWEGKHRSLERQLKDTQFRAPEESLALDRIRNNHHKIRVIFEQIVGQPETGQELRARLAGQLNTRLQAMVSDAAQLVRTSAARLEMVLQRRTIIIIICVVAVAVSLLAISVMFDRSVVRPIERLHVGTEVIGSGNLDHKVGTVAEDEIGQLSRAFDQMTSRLKTVTVSRNDLAREVAERQRAEEALRQSEQFTRSWLNLSTDGVWDWNLETNDEYLSPRFKEMFGYADPELPNHASSWQRIIHPDDLKRALQAFKEHTEEGKPFNLPVRYFHKNGSIVWVICRGVALKNEQGKFTRMVGTHTDITRLMHVEEQIRRLNAELVQRAAELETANKELEAFSYSVSHDLRAPLRAIDGFSRILQEEAGQLPAESQRHLHQVRQGAQQMGQLIDDLLKFSRTGRQPLQRQQVATLQLVRQCLEELQPEQQGRRIRLEIGELPDCWADPALLKQVFVNLLSNALKYTKQKAEAVIAVGSRPDSQAAGGRVYYVRDNGAGFDMRYADKLFGVFQRLHRSEEYAGTGVGLALAQRIVNRHGGRIWAEAEVEKGATFSFTLEGGPT